MQAASNCGYIEPHPLRQWGFVRRRKKKKLLLMGPPLIRQDEIAVLEGLQNQMRGLRADTLERSRDLFERLERGAKVEPGPLTVEVREFPNTIGSRRVLLVNGRPVDE